MKIVIIIYVCVALMPSIIHGNDVLHEQLNRMARENGTINNIFHPSQNGYLGGGAFSITFKGLLLKPIEREIAMKFTPTSCGELAEREYEAYTYLNAINNTDVERYGIPAVYYYGKWKDYILMAVTLLDSKYADKLSNRTLTDVDILIVAREFVRISKYIHSRGVHHNDVKLDNLMFRKHQAFIIDFNIANRLHRKNSRRIFGILPENVYEDRTRFAKEDWGSFLHSICDYIGVEFEEFDHCATCELLNGNPNISKSNLNTEIKRIDKIENKSFKRVFVEMAKNVFKGEIALWAGERKRKRANYQGTTTIFPHYDDLYRITNEEIDKVKLPKPVFVSWLTNEDREKAKMEEENKQLPDISSIIDCFEHVDAEYPDVNFNYFAEFDHEK